MLTHQADIEQREVRHAFINHLKRRRDVARSANGLDAKSRNRVLKIESDDRIILHDQHVTRQAVGSGWFHDHASATIATLIRTARCRSLAKRLDGFPERNSPYFSCL